MDGRRNDDHGGRMKGREKKRKIVKEQGKEEGGTGGKE
jgi:hypothetical protein